MKRRRNFKKKKFKDEARGLSVTVFNNNVEGALKVLKKKVKNSNIMQDLREKQYYRKPSEVKREKKNLQKLRYAYKNKKVQKNY
tara:strand:+ start:206 stop:457 length:252 start_codon:yes stop_codon:yes gene_type:complete